jgi:hypothetical protein
MLLAVAFSSRVRVAEVPCCISMNCIPELSFAAIRESLEVSIYAQGASFLPDDYCSLGLPCSSLRLPVLLLCECMK